MAGAVSTKCTNFILILMIIYVVWPAGYVSVTAVGIWGQLSFDTISLQILWFILGFVLDSTINGLLLFLYIKALTKFAMEAYFNLDEERRRLFMNHQRQLLDDRQHEIMLEAARYTVLFTMVTMINASAIILAICMLIYDESLPESNQNGMGFNNVGVCCFIIWAYAKEFFLLMAIQLSFVFSHSTYERRCKYCDKSAKKCCEDLVRRKNRRILISYDLNEHLL